MAGFAVQQIETAVSLFTSLCRYDPKDRRYRRNLEWLEKLRSRAVARLSAATAAQGKQSGDGAGHKRNQPHHVGDDGDAMDEFLGWRTRLIERTGRNRPTVSTILSPVTPTGSLATNNTNPSPQPMYPGNAPLDTEAMAAGALQAWPASDPTNVAVSLESGPANSNLSTFSYMVSGTRCN